MSQVKKEAKESPNTAEAEEEDEENPSRSSFLDHSSPSPVAAGRGTVAPGRPIDYDQA